jgi:nitroreductase
MNLLDQIRQRHSCRSYREEPVAREHVESLLEAARLAPSACNQQPWRFAIVTDNALRQRLVNEGFLPGIRMQWALKAPVHIVLGIKRGVVTHRVAPLLSRVDYPLIDAGIASEHLVLTATERAPDSFTPEDILTRDAVESDLKDKGTVRALIGKPLDVFIAAAEEETEKLSNT